MIEEFKKFISKGNIVDIVVGFTVGAAFSTIAKSVVEDIIMPPVGLILGKVDFTNLFFVLEEGAKDTGPYRTLGDAKTAGAVSINYGATINTVVSFFIVALAMFAVIHALTRLRKNQQEQTPPEPTNEEKLLGEIRDILKEGKAQIAKREG